MQAALRLTTTVMAGNRVEVTAPELREGEAVEVFLIQAEPAAPPRRSALDMIESLGGHRLFSSAQEVDAHLREERDAWDR